MKINNVVAFDESVMIVVNGEVPAMVTNEDGTTAQGKSDRFSMSYADLARQAYALEPDIAALRAVRGEHLSGADWVKLLVGGNVTLERHYHEAGDTEGDYTYENTGFTTTLKSLALSDKVAARLDKALGF